jgi:hypothetical protein
MENCIIKLEGRLEHYANDFGSAPEGYEANDGQLPHFHIPGPDGLLQTAKWIKLLPDGKVAGVAVGVGGVEEPYVIDLYACPDYRDNDEQPLEPLPFWFCRMLWGPSAQFAVLRDAVDELNQWDLVAEVDRYCELNREVDDAARALDALEGDLASRQEACRLCEERLIAARVPSKVGHLARHATPALKQVGRRSGWRETRKVSIGAHGRRRPY